MSDEQTRSGATVWVMIDPKDGGNSKVITATYRGRMSMNNDLCWLEVDDVKFSVNKHFVAHSEEDLLGKLLAYIIPQL